MTGNYMEEKVRENKVLITDNEVFGLQVSIFDTKDNREWIYQSNGCTTVEDAVDDYMESIEGRLNNDIKSMRHTHANVIEIHYRDNSKSYMVFSPLLEKDGKNTHFTILS